MQKVFTKKEMSSEPSKENIDVKVTVVEETKADLAQEKPVNVPEIRVNNETLSENDEQSESESSSDPDEEDEDSSFNEEVSNKQDQGFPVDYDVVQNHETPFSSLKNISDYINNAKIVYPLANQNKGKLRTIF